MDNPGATPCAGPALSRTARCTGATSAWCDVPARARPACHAELRAGRTAAGTRCPRWWSRTVFPFGLFRAWTVWRPAARVLAWPRPEHPAPPLPRQPPHRAKTACARAARAANSTACAPGGAATPAPGGVEEGGAQRRAGQPRDRRHRRRELWLDWQPTPTAATVEQRLSRLAAWVLLAEREPAWTAAAPARSRPCRPARATPTGARRWTCWRSIAHDAPPCANAWPTCRATRATRCSSWRDRLDHRAAPAAPGALVHAPMVPCLLGWRAALAGAAAPLPSRWVVTVLVLAAGLTLWSRTHAAGQGSRRHAAGGADGAEDAGTARAARRAGGLLPRLLPGADALPVFAVAGHRPVAAGLGVGPADGAGAGAHAGGPPAAVARRRAGGARRGAGRAGDGGDVRAVPAHRPAVGPAAGRRGRTGLSGSLRLGGVARWPDDDSIAMRVRFRARRRPGAVLPRAGAVQLRRPRVDAPGAQLPVARKAAAAGTAGRRCATS
jgi:hypothetical protein